MPAYNWPIIAYLAWFTTANHLTSLTIRRASPTLRRREPNIYRSAFTALLFIVLLAVFPSTGWFNWDDHNCSASAPGSAAVCYLNPVTATHLWESQCMKQTNSPDSLYYSITRMCGLFESKAMQSMIASLVILTLGLLLRIVKFSRPLSRTLYSCSRVPLSSIGRMVLIKGARYSALTVAALVREPSLRKRSETLVWELVFMPLAAYFQAIRLLMDVLSSTLAEVRIITPFKLRFSELTALDLGPLHPPTMGKRETSGSSLWPW